MLRRQPGAFNKTTSPVRDWQGLRDLLRSQRAARLVSHSVCVCVCVVVVYVSACVYTSVCVFESMCVFFVFECVVSV